MSGHFSGAKLRALRLERGLTQAELAWKLRTHERQIARWELGHNRPHPRMVKQLARALRVPKAALMDDDEEGVDGAWQATATAEGG